MRIDDLNRANVTPGSEKPGQAAPRPGEQGHIPKESSPATDQASVSQLAQSLAAPDPGRIEQLRLQVQSGSYDVPAQAVAKSIIDAHLVD